MVGTTVGATVPTTLGQTVCNALIDTGATRSCLSEEYYQQLMLPGLKPVHRLQVKTASGGNLQTTGTVKCAFKLGEQQFSFDFIVCKNLNRPCILIEKVHLDDLDLYVAMFAAFATSV